MRVFLKTLTRLEWQLTKGRCIHIDIIAGSYTWRRVSSRDGKQTLQASVPGLDLFLKIGFVADRERAKETTTQ